jgi:hypothetical protein
VGPLLLTSPQTVYRERLFEAPRVERGRTSHERVGAFTIGCHSSGITVESVLCGPLVVYPRVSTAARGIDRSFGPELARRLMPRMRGYIGVYTLKKEPLSRALIRSQLVPESN